MSDQTKFADDYPVHKVSLASSPRPGKNRNEDLAGALGTMAFVFDGASMLFADAAAPCPLDVHWYVHRLASALGHTLNGDRPLRISSALAMAIEAVAKEHRNACPDADDALAPSAAVAILRWDHARLDYLVLGDVTLVLGIDAGVIAVTDARLTQIGLSTRDRMRHHLRQGFGYDSPAYGELLSNLVSAQRAHRNTDHGYWIASLNPAAAHHALVGSHPLGSAPGHIRRAALLSDGLARAVNIFGLYDSWGHLLLALANKGPASLIAEVRHAEAADPHGRRYPRSAWADDASGIVCDFLAP